jgi:hypothetical protein
VCAVEPARFSRELLQLRRRDNSGTQEEMERPSLEARKPLPSNGSEDVTLDMGLCNREL